MNNKKEIISFVIENSVQEILEYSSEEDEYIDELIDDLIDDVLCIASFRYGIRNNIPKSKDWVTNILPSYDEHRFKVALRVSRIQFKMILEEIERSKEFNCQKSISQIPVLLQLALVLYRLGSEGQSIWKIANQFGIGDGGTIAKCTRRIFRAIFKFKKKVFMVAFSAREIRYL